LVKQSRKRVDVDPDFAEIRRVAGALGSHQDVTRQSLQIDIVARERKELDKSGNPHGDAGEDEGKKKRKPGESDADRLLRQLREDPYAREAMAILGDLSSRAGTERNLAVK
jgi:hypothetical protein